MRSVRARIGFKPQVERQRRDRDRALPWSPWWNRGAPVAM